MSFVTLSSSSRSNRRAAQRQLQVSSDGSGVAMTSGYRRKRRSLLLAGASMLALVVATQASARPLGSGASSPTPITAAQSNALAARQAAQQASRDSMLRATQALTAMRAAQTAARNLALAAPGAVPDGLAPGGLKPVGNPNSTTDGLTTWVGANAPTQATGTNGQVGVNIRQTQSNAILSWQSFNVGRNTTLTFDQQGNAGWVALNRVVGSTAPSRILGSIKSDGTVLVINQNGVIFGAGSQINVGSLMATSLDIGSRETSVSANTTIAQRNEMFLQYGVLGYADSLATNIAVNLTPAAFSALTGTTGHGDVVVEQGASISTVGSNGLIMLMAPHVINAGHLSAPSGQVILAAAAQELKLGRTTGAADSADPNMRGLVVFAQGASNTYVWNQAAGLIEANRGNISLIAPDNGFRYVGAEVGSILAPGGAVINDGVLSSTTSVSRNGSIVLSGGDIRMSSASLLSITPDSGSETIPQDAASLANFKPSSIRVGSAVANVEMESGAFLYAPGANVTFGVSSGATVPGTNTAFSVATPTIFIDSGAVLDVAGLTGVLIPASRNEVVISPVKGNELRDSPLYRASFLNGSTIYLDPRLSGVRADGVAWIGSPLIDAASYHQLVGVGASELMTKGGNVTLGATAYNGNSTTAPIPGVNAASVIVKSGAVINMAGGWVTYEAGTVRQTKLVTASGRVVPIGAASADDTYVGVYKGFTVNHARWNVVEIFASPLRSDSHYETEYTEGRDAGTLTLKAAAASFEGTIYGQAYAGQRQILNSRTGTGKSTVYNDQRAVQAATGELPAGGMLFVQLDSGGGNIAIGHNPPPLPETFVHGKKVVIAADGSYTAPVRDPNGVLPASRLNTMTLSDQIIMNAGLSQVALFTGGSITVDADAKVVLNPGGVFDALAGRNIRIDGSITAPGGKIALETYYGLGSIFVPTRAALGSFDIVVNGALSVAGRWVNEYDAGSAGMLGSAWLNGGSISMYVASRDLLIEGLTPADGYIGNNSAAYGSNASTYLPTDISGSILINSGAKLNLAGGGRIDQKGKFNLTATGGNLSLRSDTGYYQISDDPQFDLSHFRVDSNGAIALNPSQINTRIVINPGAIEAHGFGGGGNFTLVTPQFEFGTGTPTTGTVLPFDFFSTAGFATYNITSYKTDLSASKFDNGNGGYNAVLATQTLTVGANQTLLLTQSVLPSMLNSAQNSALRNLVSGGDVRSVLSPVIPDNAWDSKAVSLNFGGLIELHVAKGGSITGAAGSSLSASKLFNEGTIRIAGGTITQSLVLPSIYANDFAPNQGAVHALSEIFSVRADGTIDPNGLNAKGIKNALGRVLTNQEVAGDQTSRYRQNIYLLGILEADQGIVLAAGSVTDLSGAAITNPRAVSTNGTAIADGRIVAGGTLASLAASRVGAPLFKAQKGSVFTLFNPVGVRMPELVVAQPGSLLNLSGANAEFDVRAATGGSLHKPGYVKTASWSDAGSLLAANGATLAGANILAHGGAPQANGGTLLVRTPTLTQHDPVTPVANAISADMMSNAGFDTLVAVGSVTSTGDVTLNLGRAFFLQNLPFAGVVTDSNVTGGDPLIPVVRSGGRLEIDAPYIGIISTIDTISDPNIGAVGTGSVIFKADTIDISGTVIFDRSVANATLQATGDIRLNGVRQWQRTYIENFVPTVYTLEGAIAANGNLSLIAGQVYPTTGSTFTISSTAANGAITFGRSGTSMPAAPYSAGGSLNVYAAHIAQGGVVRVPYGTLTLGGNTAYTKINGGGIVANFAPATQNVVLLDGSITGVSANGLVIPYGTTTDLKEWYFSPTGVEALSGPPLKVLRISGSSIGINAGATVDLSGGGDVYAYEFIPGTGGSRDVLDRFNGDQYSGNKGYQYADGRQVYAIVPGLSGAPVAAYDPLYSADYGNLYSVSGVGRRVYLDAAPGLAAGWYTLLPAKYAMLPGGMRVVEQTGSGVVRGTSVRNADGSLFVSGVYGDAMSGSSQSAVKGFSVQSQAVILQNSRIVVTSGDTIAKTQAASSGTLTPRIGVDAGRLVLNPVMSLTIDAAISASAAAGGRGSQVDIGGRNFEILSTLTGAPANGAIQITADSLTRLNAGSLLIGGTRTDNADGTTNLNITAQSILVANDAAHPLSAPEIVLVVDDQIANPVASRITLADGATIIATGVLNDERSGNYIIDGRVKAVVTTTTANFGKITYINPLVTAEGALFRVANGPERLVSRLKDSQTPVVPAASLIVGSIVAKGSSVGLDTSGTVAIANDALLQAKSISLGAPAIAFTSAAAAAGAVILTPQLQALLSQGEHLTLHAQTSIGFDNGVYRFGSTTFDAQTLVAREGGSVAIAADRLRISNSTGTAGVAAGGTGSLDVTADEITFGSGAVATTGFGAGVTLTGAKGVFSGGAGGVFDFGSANLTVITPYLGDRAVTGLTSEIGAELTLKTTGAFHVTNAGTVAVDPGKLAGVPGSSLTIQGNSVTISGTRMRSTAGVLNVRSATAITLANGAVLETPGYTKTFGDSADPVTRSAPGGALTLAAQGAGGISLGDATLSVGGGAGNAGKLTLSAPNGEVDLGTAVPNGSGGAGASGGIFALNTKGAIDLVGLNNRVGANGFTGGFELRTRTGDIVLGADQRLKSGSVNLTADGGFVIVAGTIDTSGVNGGDIALYGNRGVTLEGSARLDATATGYAADDSRQASAGDVTLGTEFLAGTTSTSSAGVVTGTSGKITVAAGAVIDVSAKRPGDRLVRLLRNGVVYYQYAQGDQGGVVNFRAPVIDNGAGGKTVDVTVASKDSVVGARAVELEGFKRWDLAAVAASGLYSGVTNAAGTVTLDVAAGLDTANADGTLTTVAGLNFLGDNRAGTVVDFVQNYDVSSAYANLGGLAAEANFSSRPGLDLSHSGSIVLASNWNLGAGVVNVTGATAAGVMAVDTKTGAYVVLGREAELLENHTTMTYRVGGKPTGAAPILALRAGDDLHLERSVTDGFFQFRDQYDPKYQGSLKASSLKILQLMGADYSEYFVDWLTYTTSSSPWSSYPSQFFDSFNMSIKGIDKLLSTSESGTDVPKIPFNALGNSAAALSSGVDSAGTTGVGDALASAVVFPRLSGGHVMSSSNYRLVAGAAIGSTDPMRVANTGIGTLVVDGARPTAMVVPGGGMKIEIYDGYYGWYDDSFRAGQADFDSYLASFFPGLSADSVISLPFVDQVPAAFQTFINNTLAADPAAQVKVWAAPDQPFGYREVSISLALFSQFLQQNPAGFADLASIPLLRQNMIRTGTGSISMAAGGDVDLRGSATPQYLTIAGKVGAIPPLTSAGTTNPDQQLGGAAVYTVGRIADTSPKVLYDPVAKVSVAINPASYLPTNSAFTSPDWDYGARAPGEFGSGVPGIVLADPVYLEGGGDVSVTVGRDVLGRRDQSLLVVLDRYGSVAPWIGSKDQLWRIGTIGDATTAAINPQLFREGLGTLGGGNILISAGRDVSTISTVADTSLVTATATPTSGEETRALLTFGGGNVTINAARDILGGRLDVGSGTAQLSAGRNIGDAAGIITGAHSENYVLPGEEGPGNLRYVYTVLADQLRVRISDATANLSAGGTIAVQGVMALGVVSGPTANGSASYTVKDNLYGFYSAHSGLNLLANGSITVANKVSTGMSGGAGYIDFLAAPLNGVVGTAIYPASLSATSIAGDVDLFARGTKLGEATGANNILLVPSAHGQLQLFAGHDIAATTIAMLDSDPGRLPGLFSTYFNNSVLVTGGIAFDFPAVYSTMTDYALSQLHNKVAIHGDDREPVYLYAGNDIGTAAQGLTLSIPKQARVGAGRDIVNIMFFGQNLADTDVTRIVAGRDITATTKLVQPLTSIKQYEYSYDRIFGAARPSLQGNTIILGGVGDLFVEAGRHLGPFLNSSLTLQYLEPLPNTYAPRERLQTFGGGIMSVGNQRNPYLPADGADINVMFGVGKGADYDGLREAYVAPGSAAGTLGDYSTKLVAWMRNNASAELLGKYNTTDVSADDAYAVFVTLPELRQRNFLIKEVYFNELASTADPKSSSYLQYSRGYTAVNTLFPASLGYTANSLEGGASDAARVSTGDLDLRLAVIETMFGGDISILGPGGRVIAGSVVATSQQAARRTYEGGRLFSGGAALVAGPPTTSLNIPSGYEGVLTLRGGNIYSFTDGDFLLNQSRLFTQQGGDIKMWSSNGDLNAGQGPKTSANFPPIVARIDQNAHMTVDVAGGVTGAGIAALKSTPDAPEADVYLIAPRGTVDAGDAGLRVSGNLSIAALRVVNADNIKVGGSATGASTVQAPNVGALTEASNANTATQQAAAPQGKNNDSPSVIIVEVLGYGGGEGNDDEQSRKNNEKRSDPTGPRRNYDTGSAVQILGDGALSDADSRYLTLEERRKLSSLGAAP